ncbi:MAG: HD domain-containing protein, partial [Actinomycetota bacterium]|nr:HD domain-containing protein [Actinomycetota bacterium]
MADGNQADYEFLSDLYEGHARTSLVDSLFDLLGRMEGPTLGYRVDRAEHSRQSATRALRNGEADELVVAALFHDVGDVVAPHNHSAVAAEILAPYVSEETIWV